MLSAITMSHRKRARLGALAVASLLLGFGSPASAGFVVTNLVTNDQLANPATLTDSHLENAWGLAESPTSPFWVGDNGTGVSTLYAVNPLTNATTIAGGAGGLVVTIPGDGSVTGVAFNSGAATGAFNGDNFLFVSEDGTISGWRGALGTTAEILQTASALNVYKGTAVATIGTNSYIYAANFRSASRGKRDHLNIHDVRHSHSLRDQPP